MVENATNEYNFVHGQMTGIDDDPLKPFKFLISQNYPNPFNAQTTIQYSLVELSDVTIEIYDILGRNVATIAEGAKPAGEHQLIWNADHQPSGIYFYRIQAGDSSETKKMSI